MRTRFQIQCEVETAVAKERQLVRTQIREKIKAKYDALHVELSEPKKQAYVWLAGKVEGGKYHEKLNETCLTVCLDGEL